MIRNDEFKRLALYDTIVKNTESDKNFSIIFNISKLITQGKNRLCQDLGYKDEEKIKRFFYNKLPDIEIVDSNTFRLGSAASDVWLRFNVLDDGTLEYVGYTRPVIKVSPNEHKYC